MANSLLTETESFLGRHAYFIFTHEPNLYLANRYILDYLRNGELDVVEDDLMLRKQILREAEYFNVTPLIKTLAVKRDTSEVESALPLHPLSLLPSPPPTQNKCLVVFS